MDIERSVSCAARSSTSARVRYKVCLFWPDRGLVPCLTCRSVGIGMDSLPFDVEFELLSQYLDDLGKTLTSSDPTLEDVSRATRDGRVVPRKVQELLPLLDEFLRPPYRILFRSDSPTIREVKSVLLHIVSVRKRLVPLPPSIYSRELY